ncbi:MAG: glutaredoxin family protein [Acidobacteriia bacterium]|nr:glutaredoxin family protein [Terriglobia bacterium]
MEYEDRDVSADEQAVNDLVYKYQSRSTPTLVIGEEVMNGFDPDRLDELMRE